jgi:hypothetical protein
MDGYSLPNVFNSNVKPKPTVRNVKTSIGWPNDKAGEKFFG